MNDMKMSVKKKIVVKCGKFWMDEYEIDPEIFDDIYIESATRAIEKRKNLAGFEVTIFLECWEKKDFKRPEKHFCYNTYHVLVNAGLHDKAEALRINFMKLHGYDVKKESIKADGIELPEQPEQSNTGSAEY